MAFDPPLIRDIHAVPRLTNALRDSFQPFDFTAGAVVDVETSAAVRKAGGLLESERAPLRPTADNVTSGSVQVRRVVH